MNTTLLRFGRYRSTRGAFARSLLALLLLATAQPLAADTMLLDQGEVLQGSLWSDNEQTTIGFVDDPQPPLGHPSVRIAFDAGYRSGGIGFYGPAKLNLPAGIATCRLTVMSPTHDAYLSKIQLNLNGRAYNFSGSEGRWTLDGEPGHPSQLVRATWHTIELYLSPAVSAGALSGRVKGHLALIANKAGSDGLVVHLGQVVMNADSDAAPPATDQPDTPPATPPTTGNTPPAKPQPKTKPAVDPSASPGPVTLTIHPEPLQEITQWGIITNNRPDWGDSWDITQYPRSLDALYQELGATLVRFHIDYNTYDKPKAREILKNAVLAVTERGRQWYGVPWSPPASFKTLDTVNGRLKGEINHLAEGYEDDVAAWLVDLTQWLHDRGVPDPLALSPQNEPDWPPPNYPGCIYSGQQIRTAIVELRQQLNAAGFSNIKVIGDEGGASVSKTNDDVDGPGTVNMLGLFPGRAYHTDTAFRESLDVIATHTYDIHNGVNRRYPGHLQDWHDIVSPLGVELWMTEWEVRHEHAFSDWDVLHETLTHFNRDMSSLGFNGWISWMVWKGWTLDGPPEEGDQVSRIRAGDVLFYEGIDVGHHPQTLHLCAGNNSTTMDVSLHVGSPDAPAVVTYRLPETPGHVFRDIVIDLPAQSELAGEQDVYLKFSSDEHWRESWLQWFAFGDGPRIEAEDFTRADATESWSSTIKPAYRSNARKFWVYDDGTTLQRRPLFYIFKKLWNAAPAGQGTTVRRVTSSDNDTIQGESKQARIESHRQDVSAFVHDGQTTVMLINRNDFDQLIHLRGLTGSAARAYRYLEADAQSIN
ncbi:MAG: hypothetical protein AAF086_09325, partial [Planctomycetota bacterium]